MTARGRPERFSGACWERGGVTFKGAQKKAELSVIIDTIYLMTASEAFWFKGEKVPRHFPLFSMKFRGLCTDFSSRFFLRLGLRQISILSR